MVYLADANPYTRGPGRYKIPGFGDIPLELTVSLLRNAANKRAVYSSKAVGEPPLFLGAAVFYAIKDAIAASRKEHMAAASQDDGDGAATSVFRLDSPATAERIRLACGDKIAQAFPPLAGARWNTLA